MNAADIVLLVIATLMFVYLGVALFNPERFLMSFALTLIALAVCLGLTWRYLGSYMVSVYAGRVSWLSWVERPTYRLLGVDPDREQGWQRYTAALLVFSAISILLTYGLLRLQASLPLNPQHLPAVSPGLAWNTAVSFVTNTNWQNYSGESTMTYFSQMVALTVQNFVSPAVGLVVAIAVIRGFSRRSTAAIGNFWVDLVRSVLYILLPIAFIVALVFVAQGSLQTLAGPAHIHDPLNGVTQTIPRLPLASQEVIKQLGTNGGGPFNANGAHPYENPTGLTNFLSILLVLAIPVALTYTFGKMVGQVRQGAAVLAAMTLLFGVWLAVATTAEQGPNPAVAAGGLVHQPGGNVAGKEARFGVASSALYAIASTQTSTGSIDGANDSYTPLGGLALMAGMAQGETTPGGVGSGLYTILLSAIVTVFIGGLMVGRTPEYLGKKIQAREVKLAAFGVLVMPVSVLVLTGIASAIPAGTHSVLNHGPQGFSEIFYALLSQGNNNGSAFAGLNGNTPFYNLVGGIDMLIGRFGIIVPALALAGVLAKQATVPVSAGTFRTDTPMFVGLLVGVILLVGALTFFPAVSLGPLVQQFSHGRLFLMAASPHGVVRQRSLFDLVILRQAALDAIRKLDPRVQLRNPVMFVVLVGTVITAAEAIAQPSSFAWQITIWLLLTVLFANFAEAMAEGRGKAQADTLRRTRTDTVARLLGPDGAETRVPASQLRRDQLVVCEADDVVPSDGEITEGVASIDESAITGESAPVIRESGGDRSAVTGGTRVLSDRIVVRITAEPGHTFLDRMITLVEGANRQKTPNEIALTILLAALTLIFLPVVVVLQPFAGYAHGHVSVVILIGLLVCLIPTTVGALLSAVGIAGMDRLVQRNVLAMSGRAVEAAGDVSTLLLDKTGTITLGNRMASAFLPVGGCSEAELADASQLASLADDTPEGRSIAVLAKSRFNLRERDLSDSHHFIAFSARTRMSGLDVGTRRIRKGATPEVRRFVEEQGGTVPEELEVISQRVARSGATPLAVADGAVMLGVIELKDVVKTGITDRFAQLRTMGIRTVMVTGDNPLTAAAIAAEAGVDDFLAEATPETKLALIRSEQAGGQLVAMMGDGTNDAPALAQADVGVAMNTGTAAAKEAGNMVDLDSNPTKLIDVVEIGKQLLITRGALTTFSIANDVAKYFAIIPALFASTYPQLEALNVMKLHSPTSAVLSAVIFNAIIIVALIPLALRGVRFRPSSPASLLRRNVWIYGVGGVVIPFLGIKLIDMLLTASRLV